MMKTILQEKILKYLLITMSLGLLAYGVWKFVEPLFPYSPRGKDYISPTLEDIHIYPCTDQPSLNMCIDKEGGLVFPDMEVSSTTPDTTDKP